ncbi:hypothetical protein J2X72_003745 [Phyllobacterium sp. 1468]|nr:hypothetical protein [Phyllobacterium sp. 1468]
MKEWVILGTESFIKFGSIAIWQPRQAFVFSDI